MWFHLIHLMPPRYRMQVWCGPRRLKAGGAAWWEPKSNASKEG